MAESKILTAKALCTISTRSTSARANLNKLAQQLYADGADPIELKCLRCGIEWEISPIDDWHQATCSNCYSERLVITKILLEFDNWGDQNGGEKEQRERYERAKDAYDRVAEKLDLLRAPNAQPNQS